jgi:signal transduction histidine kinase
MDLLISDHECRSGTLVETGYPRDLPVEVPAPIKTCAYRFVQEGLNNAFRHAGGVGQRVDLSWDGSQLTVEVSDRGPGIVSGAQTSAKSGLGLNGLRDRIEALGGAMQIVSGPETGTHLKAIFPLTEWTVAQSGRA